MARGFLLVAYGVSLREVLHRLSRKLGALPALHEVRLALAELEGTHPLCGALAPEKRRSWLVWWLAHEREMGRRNVLWNRL